MTPGAGRPSALQLTALAGLSAGMLAFEVLLLRLFAFSHWHHFAGLAVSLALLGLGAAGTTLVLLRDRPARWGDRWLHSCLLATAAGLLLVLALHARVALRPAFAAWDAGELARLLLVDLLAFLPFYATGLAVGQVFVRWPAHPRLLYAANLLGAGLGAVGASVLLALVHVETALAAVAALLLALAASFALGQRRYLAAVASLPLLLLALLAVLRPPAAAVSDFKALARLQELPGAQVLAVLPGLPGRLTLIRADSLRIAPGLSLGWPQPVASVDAVVIGSDRVVAMPRAYPALAEHAAASLLGLPLLLRPGGEVLALGSGTWHTPAAAAGHDLTWLEPDRRILAIARQRGAGGERWQLIEDSEYRYLATQARRYDLISVDRAYQGGDAATEDYLITIEGLALALSRLHSDGLLALPLELSYPPRRFPRALATVVAALDRQGAHSPGDHLMVLRSLQSLLILASPTPLQAADKTAVRHFAERWGFDLVWLPDIIGSEVNRYHRLDTPAFYLTASAVLRGETLPDIARWFATGPADLSQPYVWRSLAWRRLPSMLEMLGPRGLSYLDWTLLFAALSTVLVTLLAFLLILGPLRRLPVVLPPFSRLSIAGYFTALGLGYMLLEMALFQRAILYLGEPVLAASLVFAVFLIGSGLGSASAPTTLGGRTIATLYATLALGMLLAMAGLRAFSEALAVAPLALRMTLLTSLLLPLAWAMGRPFPWALRQLAGQPRWLPWAWGINAFASVAAASLAPLVSVHLGQPITISIGVACYAAALVVALGWLRAKKSDAIGGGPAAPDR